MTRKEFTIKNYISPEKIIHNRKVFKIISYPPSYLIKGYEVTEINERIFRVHINGKHPNAKPSTGDFCLPYELRRVPFNDDTRQMLELILTHFNLDDCYFTPWNEIQYIKQEV